jgi:hypothetical protein
MRIAISSGRWLALLTNPTDNPRLVIFRYSKATKGCIDVCCERAASPTIKTLEAAIVSLY